MKFYAHTVEDGEGRTLYTLKDGRQTTAKPRLSDLAEEQIGWQPLSSHLVNVAEQSRNFAEFSRLPEEAFLAGLLHDLGKYRQKFQLMLRGLKEESPHAYAGSSICQNGGSAGFMAASFAIGGHHAGLPNGMAANKERIQRSWSKPQLQISESGLRRPAGPRNPTNSDEALRV
jgi:CRISPR-associated endonuclease/helicase Cas3